MRNGRKILVIGIYSPLENKGSFYAKLQRKILDYYYQNFIVVGDFNGVIEPKIDRKLEKEMIKAKQGKLLQKFFDLKDNLSLIEIWRHLYDAEKSYTYYSNSHESLARIDMCLVSSSLIREIESMKVLNRDTSDHNPIKVTFKEIKNSKS